MKSAKLSLPLLTLLFSSLTWAYGTGITTHPLSVDEKLLTTEFTSQLSNGTGKGLQARFSQRIDQKTTFDAGFGVSDGDRSNRVFAGLDFLLYPDYQKQPKITVKGTVESAKEFGNRRNLFGVTPTLSKGFNFWGKEAYPFLAFPIELSLDSDTKKYETVSKIALGLTGPLPFEGMGYNKIVGSVEANINMNNGFSALYFGLSYSL